MTGENMLGNHTNDDDFYDDDDDYYDDVQKQDNTIFGTCPQNSIPLYMVIIMEMTMIITTTFTITISLAFIMHGDHHRHADDLDRHRHHRPVIDQVEELGLHLPPRCLGSIWSLAYATDQHGHITSSFRS